MSQIAIDTECLAVCCESRIWIGRNINSRSVGNLQRSAFSLCLEISSSDSSSSVDSKPCNGASDTCDSGKNQSGKDRQNNELRLLEILLLFCLD